MCSQSSVTWRVMADHMARHYCESSCQYKTEPQRSIELKFSAASAYIRRLSVLTTHRELHAKHQCNKRVIYMIIWSLQATNHRTHRRTDGVYEVNQHLLCYRRRNFLQRPLLFLLHREVTIVLIMVDVLSIIL